MFALLPRQYAGSTPALRMPLVPAFIRAVQQQRTMVNQQPQLPEGRFCGSAGSGSGLQQDRVAIDPPIALRRLIRGAVAHEPDKALIWT